jgi:hypothetical protein
LSGFRENRMSDVVDALVLDLVEWIAKEPRPYRAVMEAWRTSCPRLTVWEEAVERGLVCRKTVSGEMPMVELTALGEQFLREKTAVTAAVG